MHYGAMAKSLDAQLFEAWDRSSLTLGELRAKAGLDCDDTSLGRKLRGKQILTTKEAEALATALHVRLAFGREARAS